MAKDIKKTENNDVASKVLIEPWITEASTMMAEMNKYVFKVFAKAGKGKIKESIESLYGVNVKNVRTMNIAGKTRFRGGIMGKKPGFKKAIVTLKEGDSINIYEEK